jgi:hypothetical protein
MEITMKRSSKSFDMTATEMSALDRSFNCMDVAHRIERGLKHSTAQPGELIQLLVGGMLREEWAAVAAACRAYISKPQKEQS